MKRSAELHRFFRLGCLSMMVLAVLLMAGALQAQTFQVLHKFTAQGDGANPSAGMLIDRGGRLYGPTSTVSAFSTAYKLSPAGEDWVLSSLHELPDGANAFVFGPDGAIYGTTSYGGQGDCSEGGGCGTVFKLQPPASTCRSTSCPWIETVLYRFQGGTDGWFPSSGVVFDRVGNLYGVTAHGGTGTGNCDGIGCGTVYELSPSSNGWSETVIYNFQGADDGWWPVAGLIIDAAGNLFGTTLSGGPGGGALYELSPSHGGWFETNLHEFVGNDGTYPVGTLTFDASGNIYGVTTGGGTGGGGTVFELAHPGNWTYSVLYDFAEFAGPDAPLSFDSQGNIYGVTVEGGVNGYGSVYKLSSSNGSWVLTDLHDFNITDGMNPNGGLVLDANGNIYGTAMNGGGFFTTCALGCGTAWEITP